MTAGAMRPRRFAGVFTHRHTAENIWKAIAHATSMRTTVQEKVKDSAHPSNGGKAIIVHAPCWSEIQPSRASLRMRGLLWWAIAFAPLASSAIYLVWKGRERSLGARAASILAGNIMGPVAFSLAIADGSPAAVTLQAWATCAAFGLHYIGTVPLVRSMIRGRKDPRWAMGSTLLHAAFTLCAAVAWWFGALTIWPVLMWACLTARAWVLPTLNRSRARPFSPKFIGFSELGWSLLLIASLLIP